jgi:hypothetical protein
MARNRAMRLFDEEREFLIEKVPLSGVFVQSPAHRCGRGPV